MTADEVRFSGCSTGVCSSDLALALPETFGGLALVLVELGLVAHQAGRMLSGAPFLTSSFGAPKAIELYGSAVQKARWLPSLASGETIGAIAFAGGADALPAHPTATLTGGRLPGPMPGVTGGPPPPVPPSPAPQ